MGTNKDSVEAYKKYLLAVKYGNSIARYDLGKCYECGIGTPYNIDSAFSNYLEGAKAGIPQAIWRLIHFYHHGYGDMGNRIKLPQNVQDRAKKYYSKWSMANSMQVYDFENSNYEEIKKLFDTIARQEENGEKWLNHLKHKEETNDPYVFYYLGVCYQTGIGVEMNSEIAFSKYYKASKLNCKEALFELAHCYIFGIGTVKDPSKGFKIYKRLSKEGDLQATYYLRSLL